MSNIVKYGSYDAGAAEDEQKALAEEGKGLFSFKEGKSVIRVLPPPLGSKSPFKMVWAHNVNIPDGSFKSFTCLEREGKKPCPLCAKANRLKASGNPADFERAKEWFPRRRIFTNIIDREKPENGPQVAVFGKTIHEALVALRTDPDAGGDFTHPENGFDIIVERKGKGKNDTEYKVFAARKESPLGEMDWIAMQTDLNQFAKMLTADEIIAIMRGEKGAQQTQQPQREVAPQQATTPAPQTQRPPPARAATVDAAPASRTVEHDSAQKFDEDVPF